MFITVVDHAKNVDIQTMTFSPIYIIILVHIIWCGQISSMMIKPKKKNLLIIELQKPSKHGQKKGK